VNGFDNVILDAFLARIEKYGMTKDDIELVRLDILK
jgi:hypothetical protein